MAAKAIIDNVAVPSVFRKRFYLDELIVIDLLFLQVSSSPGSKTVQTELVQR
ncbi:hypothetical protein JOC94_004596 [Bacillus thermophilus]|uniref:Uncharacterized protein n=1 Tax=Siminovitchia thermophila TaxID=1245522 RepID=A0ABS2RD36_9BACI|nr:hypothetical protein [Siminovitchia thermophila]